MDKPLDQAETGLPLPMARCLSKEQAAAYLGIGLTLLAELSVPHVRFGRRCVYDKLELATNEPGRLDRGMGYTVPVLAEQIKELCARWPQSTDGRFQRVRPTGVADDAIFAATGSGAGSISEEFRRAGVNFSPAKKADRLTGWNIMRRLLQDAGKPDMPGLYIARHCEYAWETLPILGRDPRRVEDLDSRGPDHAADALRYGCLRRVRTAVVMPFPAM